MCELLLFQALDSDKCVLPTENNTLTGSKGDSVRSTASRDYWLQYKREKQDFLFTYNQSPAQA